MVHLESAILLAIDVSRTLSYSVISRFK